MSVWRRLLIAVLGGGVLLVGFIGWGFRNIGLTPVERQAILAMPDWPEGAAPIKVALLSDIHIGNSGMSADRLNAVVDQVNAAHPDLVVLAGDFVNGHDRGMPTAAANLTEPLSRLYAPLGIVAVLGNHDYWTDPEAVRAALTAAGVTVLENEASQRGPVALIGVADAFSHHDRTDDAFADAADLTGPRIVLTHSPDIAPGLPPEGALLMAGHTHCGQVVLPLIGPLVSSVPRGNLRTLYNPRYRCGVIRDPGRVVVVTAGVGSGSAPVRFGAPTDWWLLTLGPAS